MKNIENWLNTVIIKIEYAETINMIVTNGNLSQFLQDDGKVLDDEVKEVIISEVLLKCCEEVMNTLLANNVKYSIKERLPTKIEQTIDFSNKNCCCATFIAAVLYKAGSLSSEHIDSYNFNYTGDNGKAFVAMLDDVNWKRVSEDEVQPGDICLYTPANGKAGHVFIYAGEGFIWDQSSGCISSKGDAPSMGPEEDWEDYKNNYELIIWRPNT